MIIDYKTLLNWSVSLSLDGTATASIRSSDPDSYDIADALKEKVELILRLNGSSKTWFKGNIVSTNAEYIVADNERVIQFDCESYFNSLSRKPVNTEKYTSKTGKEILEELLGVYGCINSSLYDMTVCSGTSFSNIVVVEDSLLQAVKLIAQACGKEVFINSDGNLVAANYRVTGDSVDYAIPQEYIISAKRTRSNDISFSKIRVRGRYKSVSENPNTTFVNDTVTLYLINDSTSEIFTFTVGSANKQELENASYTSSTSGITFKLINVTDSIVTIKAIKSPGTFVAGANSFNLNISGKSIKQEEALGFSNSHLEILKPKHYTIFSTYHKLANSGRNLSGFIIQSLKTADEPELSRIESVVEDSGLISEIGVRWLDIDNMYIPDDTVCTNVGNRKIVEFKQSRATWSVNCIYNENLNVNKTVSFKYPGGSTIKGVIRKLEINYNAEETLAEMNFVLEEIEGLI